jgi:hypothetical protein
VQSATHLCRSGVTLFAILRQRLFEYIGYLGRHFRIRFIRGR